jgi:putative colanic acid biosynthesis acetyltransferase WcaF
VVIEDECWITNDVYVAPGVKIGKGSIVAARSSVFKNIPEGKIYAGTPAVEIKNRI